MAGSKVLLAFALAAAYGSSVGWAGEWVKDLSVVGADFKPLPERLSGAAGDAVDVVVGFLPGEPKKKALEGRKVRGGHEWRLRAEVLDAAGEVRAAEPVEGLCGELHGFDWIGFERLDSKGPDDGKVLWESPEPTEEIATIIVRQKRRGPRPNDQRWVWGHTRLPDEPGDYRLVIRLYPTADPRPVGRGDGNPTMGSPVELASVPLVVTARDQPRPRITSSMHKDLIPGNPLPGLRARDLYRDRPGGGRGPGRLPPPLKPPELPKEPA